MAEEFDFHPMWESLGMNLADHDMLLAPWARCTVICS